MSSGVAAAYWTDLPLTSVTGAGLALGIALAMAPIALSIESVWRRARQGEPRQTAVWQGTWSVFPAVAALTACALASLIPLVFIQELACQAIRPLLLPLAATVAGAFVITLTLVPALAQLFLSWGEPGRLLGPGRWIGGAAGALASFGVKQRVVGFLAGLAALVAAILLALLIDTAVLPQGREDLLRVELTAAPNTTHATVRQAVLDADRLLAEVAGVRKVLAGAQGALSPLRGNEIDPVLSAPDGLLLVRFSGNASLARRVDMVAAALADIDVVRARIAPIEASEALTQFQVSVLGITDAAARNAAQDLASQLEGVAPPVQIRLLPKPPETSYQVHVDPQSAIQQGLVTATETARQVNQLLSGQRLGSTRIGGEERLDVWLTINPALMNNLDKLRGLPIGSGEATALMSVASVNEAVTPVELFRQDGQPAAIVSGTLLGRDSRNATAILKQANDYEAASGMTVQVSGLPVVERQSLRWLAIAPLISAALVFVIALAVTGSLASGLAVLIGATTAGIAAVMSLITFGRPVDLPAVVGFVLIPCVAAAGGLAFVGAMRRANQRGLPAAEAVQESISERGSALALVTIPSMGAFVVLGLGFVSSGPVLGHASTVIAAGSISAAVLGTIAVAAAYALGAGLKPQRPAPTPPPPHPEPQDGGPPTPAPVA
jgi:multidrug efflux pump subunit AcrB